MRFLARNGYARAGTVREPGDFALRGGIVDLWPPGTDEPLRLDFFGDDAGSDPPLRCRNAAVHRREVERSSCCRPAKRRSMRESISRFRAGYVAAFGPAGDDPLYEAVSAGRKHQGMEHWLPLFYPQLDTLFDYLAARLVLLGHHAEEAKNARLELIADYYDTRESIACRARKRRKARSRRRLTSR